MRLALPRARFLDLSRRPLVMGIINVTPDSFSDGGVHFDRDVAIESALRMVEEGAELVDIGGESTRPGAAPVSVQGELDRVLPVLEGVRARSDVPISIDTMKAAVARRALEAGADLVNDVTAFRFDRDMAAVVRDAGVPVILMHMRGEPRTMQQNIHYDDLVGEIKRDLSAWCASAVAQGIDRSRILVDPGIGFGKSFEHNIEILARAAEFAEIGPVVIGASRKAFIGHLTGAPSGPARAAGSLAAVAAAAWAGAAIVRVHDVRDTVGFLKVLRPILRART
jgi:dihydropteroate synthase